MKTTTLWTALLISAGLSVLPGCKDKGKDMPAGDMGGEMAKPADDMGAGAASDDKKMDPGK